MVIIVAPKFMRLLNASAFTILFFIFVKEAKLKLNKVLINHEKIHLEQQLELLFVFQWILYLLNYIILFATKLIKSELKNIRQYCYKNIAFELEAYDKEKELGYLWTRKPYSWVKYIKI